LTEINCGILHGSLTDAIMATVTKKELIAELSDATGIKHADVTLFMESFMELVIKHLAAGDEITLRNFGTFDLRVAKGKLGRNPRRVNSEVMIPDRCVVRFRPSGGLKSRVASVPTQLFSDVSGNGNHSGQ